MSVTTEVRNRDEKIFANVIEFGRRSIRTIAKTLGMSKDKVARGLAAINERDEYPESHLWETKEGRAWLLILVLAVIYLFSLKGNQGTERMSEFFELIRLDGHVGVSPSSLRKMRREMEKLLVEFQRTREAQQREKGKENREIVASGDETWFNDDVLLVLLDLVSGYLIVEEAADDRSYETWNAKAQTRLKELGLRARHFISDRGKSLVKLATASFGCLAGADIFHAQYGVSKWLGRSLHGKLGSATKQLRAAKAKLVKLGKREAKPDEIAAQERCVREKQKKLDVVEAGKQAYGAVQRTISAVVHAFAMEDNRPQGSEQVEERLEEQAQSLERIALEHSVKDNKDAVGKFRRQIEDVASIVDAWWLWTEKSLDDDVGIDIRNWLLYVLLPVIYWYDQLQKTRNPEMREVYQAALQKAQAAYRQPEVAHHPVTQTISKKELDRWRAWAKWASGNFVQPRLPCASSAMEGRNGSLSQSYHNGRGLTSRRLGALTAIHNYDTRRSDGSTPAERLYNDSLICSIGCSIEWETRLSHANPDGALLTILWLSVLSRLKLIP